MGKIQDFNGFLSGNGKLIYDDLYEHCTKKLKMYEIDHFELSMLANSFALYAECARICNDEGVSMSFGKKDAGNGDEEEDDDDKKVKSKGGIYQQIRPEYTVMKNEYANILKHSPKFGLNPGDRARLFKGLDKKEKKKVSEGID
jgi:hypothetical protein